MLIDNVTNKVADILAEAVEQGDKLSVMTGLFSIYAFDHLKSSLGKVESARLLFSQAKGFDLLPDESIPAACSQTSRDCCGGRTLPRPCQGVWPV